MADQIESISIDRLSSLHDSILTHILSFLPTRDSVRTSVLAKRYRCTWSSVRALRFNLSSPDDVDLVDGALAHISPSDVTTFGVVAKPFGLIDGNRVLSWVDYVGARNVRRLELKLTAKIESIEAIFRCQSLEVLDLDRFILRPYRIPDLSAPILPNLRTLRLRLLPITLTATGDWIGKFVSSCCQLEDLILSGGLFDCFDISATKLRRLELELWATEVQINCPMLEYLYFVVEEQVRTRLHPLMKFRGYMPSLRQANICVPIINARSQGCWSQILQSVKNATYLRLSSCFSFKRHHLILLGLGGIGKKSFCTNSFFLVSGDILEDPDSLPIFHNLTALKLHECFHYHSIKFMVYMLENSLRLSFLSILSLNVGVDKRQKWRLKKLP